MHYGKTEVRVLTTFDPCETANWFWSYTYFIEKKIKNESINLPGFPSHSIQFWVYLFRTRNYIRFFEGLSLLSAYFNYLTGNSTREEYITFFFSFQMIYLVVYYKLSIFHFSSLSEASYSLKGYIFMHSLSFYDFCLPSVLKLEHELSNNLADMVQPSASCSTLSLSKFIMS